MAFNNKEELKSKTHSQDFIPSFIRKTYDILEEGRFPQYIDWSADGTAIVIKKPSEFSQKVLPVYFKHNNFTSFVRQLNMYNFHKRRTQSLDHVYVHELFQRGKRHLLQEIKRKSHDHNAEKTPKIPEVQEPVKTGGDDDLSSLAKENQFFKRLYTEAMNRLATLERQAKELAAQNQTLWTQVHHKNERDRGFKPFIARFDSQSELTLDQLPMTLGKMPLNMNSAYKAQAQMSRAFAQKAGQFMRTSPMANNVNDFTSIGEESSAASTEVSRSSPAFNSEQESEGSYDGSRLVSQRKSNVSFCPQLPQVQSLRICNELSVSRQEMSTGQLFSTWNFELESDDMLCFADQKVDAKPNVNIQPATLQEKNLLGKRQLETENQENLEPAMKRHELCIFSRKGVISNGFDDKEMIGTTMYFGNNPIVSGGYELNMGIDLMDF